MFMLLFSLYIIGWLFSMVILAYVDYRARESFTIKEYINCYILDPGDNYLLTLAGVSLLWPIILPLAILYYGVRLWISSGLKLLDRVFK